MGDKLVLINSAISSLSMFMFCFFEAPKGVLKKLDTIDLGFSSNVMSIRKSTTQPNGVFMRSETHRMMRNFNLENQNKCLLSGQMSFSCQMESLVENGLWQDLLKRKCL